MKRKFLDDEDEWKNESHFDSDLNSFRKKLEKGNTAQSDSDSDEFDQRGLASKKRKMRERETRRPVSGAKKKNEKPFNEKAPWPHINPRKNGTTAASDGKVPTQESSLHDSEEEDLTDFEYFGDFAEECSPSPVPQPPPDKVPEQEAGPGSNESVPPPHQPEAEKNGNDIPSASSEGEAPRYYNPMQASNVAGNSRRADDEEEEDHIEVEGEGGDFLNGMYGGDGEDDGVPVPVDDEDVVHYDPKLAEACLRFGHDKDDPSRCALCFLGFDSKDTKAMHATVQDIKNRHTFNSNKNHIMRIILLVRDYNTLLRDPLNRVTKAEIDQHPDRKAEILKKRPLIPKLTHKQAWWHYEKPHVKDHQNAMLLRIERLQIFQEGLHQKLMLRALNGREEINTDIIDSWIKICKLENETRNKQFTNPMFGSSATATAICAAVLGSKMSVETEIKKRNDYTDIWGS